MALVEVMLWGVERMSRTSPWGRMGVDMPADVNHRAGRNRAGSTGLNCESLEAERPGGLAKRNSDPGALRRRFGENRTGQDHAD